jgi:hypothetical protein
MVRHDRRPGGGVWAQDGARHTSETPKLAALKGLIAFGWFYEVDEMLLTLDRLTWVGLLAAGWPGLGLGHLGLVGWGGGSWHLVYTLIGRRAGVRVMGRGG